MDVRVYFFIFFLLYMGIYVDNYYYNITGEIVHEIGFKHEEMKPVDWVMKIVRDCGGTQWPAGI